MSAPAPQRHRGSGVQVAWTKPDKPGPAKTGLAKPVPAKTPGAQPAAGLQERAEQENQTRSRGKADPLGASSAALTPPPSTRPPS